MARAAWAAPSIPANLDELAILVVASTVAAIVAYPDQISRRVVVRRHDDVGGVAWQRARGGVMPWWVTNTVMIASGAVTGSRFAGTPIRMLLHFISAAFGSFAVAVTITALFATALVGVLHLPIAEVMIAYAPGAVDTLMLLALALNLDPVYVGAHHLVRIFVRVDDRCRWVARYFRPDAAAKESTKPPRGTAAV